MRDICSTRGAAPIFHSGQNKLIGQEFGCEAFIKPTSNPGLSRPEDRPASKWGVAGQRPMNLKAPVNKEARASSSGGISDSSTTDSERGGASSPATTTRGKAPAPPTDKRPTDLPEGWKAYLDKTGKEPRWYYHHRETGVTQWDRPLGGGAQTSAPPPPPPAQQAAKKPSKDLTICTNFKPPSASKPEPMPEIKANASASKQMELSCADSKCKICSTLGALLENIALNAERLNDPNCGNIKRRGYEIAICERYGDIEEALSYSIKNTEGRTLAATFARGVGQSQLAQIKHFLNTITFTNPTYARDERLDRLKKQVKIVDDICRDWISSQR